MNITQHFRNKGINIKNEYVQHLKEETDYSVDEIFEKFLNTDISETCNSNESLITALQKKEYSLEKSLVVQIDEVVDVSIPRKDRSNNKCSDFPTYKLLINDGGMQMAGVMQTTNTKINSSSTPGIKIEIKEGTLLCYGVFLLHDSNINYHGGSSPNLIKKKRKTQQRINSFSKMFSKNELKSVPDQIFGIESIYHRSIKCSNSDSGAIGFIRTQTPNKEENKIIIEIDDSQFSQSNEQTSFNQLNDEINNNDPIVTNNQMPNKSRDSKPKPPSFRPNIPSKYSKQASTKISQHPIINTSATPSNDSNHKTNSVNNSDTKISHPSITKSHDSQYNGDSSIQAKANLQNTFNSENKSSTIDIMKSLNISVPIEEMPREPPQSLAPNSVQFKLDDFDTAQLHGVLYEKKIHSLYELLTLPDYDDGRIIRVNANVLCVKNESDVNFPNIAILSGNDDDERLEISIDIEFIQQILCFNIFKAPKELASYMYTTVNDYITSNCKPPLHIFDKGKGNPIERFYLTE